LHLIVAKPAARGSKEQRLVEVQLRNVTEHSWAETVMHTGNRLRSPLQDGQGPAELLEYFRLASDVIYSRDRGLAVDPEFDERFREIREQVRPYFQGS
jgi:ppGpp synthetase/RelA/SpoT-type nucleotidyltranferase